MSGDTTPMRYKELSATAGDDSSTVAYYYTYLIFAESVKPVDDLVN